MTGAGRIATGGECHAVATMADGLKVAAGAGDQGGGREPITDRLT
jgi:hypothetical protein